MLGPPGRRGARETRAIFHGVRFPALFVLALTLLLAACAPAVEVEDTGAHLQPFTLDPVPRDQRYVIAVPSFTVGAGSVRIGSVDLSKEGETAVDIVAYAAHVAAQLGAHIIKVKPPSAHVEMDANRKMIESQGIKIDTLADRVRFVMKAAFDGKRIVIFSGGEAKGTEAVLEEIRQIRDGGGMGSIMGRNAFQRPKEEAIQLLHTIMDIYAGKA